MDFNTTGIKVTKLKFGGTIKDQQKTRPDPSRNYGGHRNTSQKIKEEIKFIEKTELLHVETLIESHKSRNLAKFGVSRAPKRLYKLREGILRKISELRKIARDTDGLHGESVTVEKPKPIYIGVK